MAGFFNDRTLRFFYDIFDLEVICVLGDNFGRGIILLFVPIMFW